MSREMQEKEVMTNECIASFVLKNGTIQNDSETTVLLKDKSTFYLYTALDLCPSDINGIIAAVQSNRNSLVPIAGRVTKKITEKQNCMQYECKVDLENAAYTKYLNQLEIKRNKKLLIKARRKEKNLRSK